MPPRQQTIDLLTPIADTILCAHPYPAYVVDFRNDIWACNASTRIFFESQREFVDAVSRPANLFHFLFDSRLSVMRTFEGLEEAQAFQIAVFKALNVRRQHEPFYRDFPAWVGQHLLPEDAATFARIWAEQHAHEIDDGVLYATRLTFHLHAMPPITFQLKSEYVFNFDNIFAVIRYEPDDSPPGSSDRADALCRPLRPAPPLKLWELRDIAPLLDA
jgi:hypothetical protein